MTENEHTDGNALAGPLSEVFATDVTASISRCANCGRTGPVAALHVYSRAPGLVARCQNCGEVMLRIVRGKGVLWLDMRNTASLAITVDDQ